MLKTLFVGFAVLFSTPLAAQSAGTPLQPWDAMCEAAFAQPATTDAAARCVVHQQPVSEEGRRQILRVGCLPTAGEATMRLVLPIGLKVARPLTPVADHEAPAMPSLSTGRPQGCIVLHPSRSDEVAPLRSGSERTVAGRLAGGLDAAHAVNLTGFPAAFDRAAAGEGSQ